MALKLKLRRIQLGIKQKDVAARAGISQQYLSNIENGRTTNPNLNLMKKLAIILKTTPQELFFDE